MTIQGQEIILKGLVGSHSYGTNIEGSDRDYKGIFIQSPESVLIDGYIPQIEVGKDEVYFEVGRFLDLCSKANPTMLELLFLPDFCIEYKHPVFDIILKERTSFLTKECKLAFGGYAIQQIKKARGLDKKMNWETDKIERRNILDFCYVHTGIGSTPLKDFLKKRNLVQEQAALVKIDHMKDCYTMYFDMRGSYTWPTPVNGIAKDILKSNSVSLSSVPLEIEKTYPAYLLYFNIDAYSMHCRDYNSYQNWLKERNVQRYVDIKEHGQKIDGKNMLHCVRLIETALEIPEQKFLNVFRKNADYLISIRKGNVDLETILAECENKITQMDESFEKSDLPNTTNKIKMKSILIHIRTEFEKSKQQQKKNY